jgi:hypothetical protein
MPPFSTKDRLNLSFRVRLLSSLLGLISILVLIDGLWGFGQRIRFFLFVFLAGLCVIAGVEYGSRASYLSVIGVILSASVMGCLGVEFLVWYCLTDFTIPIDERGFQKRVVASWPNPVETPQRKGVQRVLGLSDSYGQAGREGNFYYLLSGLLTGQGITTETVNLSISGAHPTDEQRLLQQFGPRFQPDIVLNGIFVGNDFFFSNARTVEVAGIPLLQFSVPSAFRPQHLLLFQWVRGECKLLKENFLLWHERWMGLPSGETSEKEFLWIESKYLLTCKKGAPNGIGWMQTMNAIHQIQEESVQMGARYVMVILPDQCQVDTRLCGEVMETYGLNPNDFDLELPQRYLKEDCALRGIPCLDLLPAFREQGAKGGLYRFRDTHWNEAGNRLAAKCILDFLLSQRLVTAPMGVP